jgi:hypothetical protein
VGIKGGAAVDFRSSCRCKNRKKKTGELQSWGVEVSSRVIGECSLQVVAGQDFVSRGGRYCCCVAAEKKESRREQLLELIWVGCD